MYTNYGTKAQQIDSEITELVSHIRELVEARDKASKEAVKGLVKKIRNATSKNGSTAREIYNNLPNDADISFESLVGLLTWACGNQSPHYAPDTTIPFKSVKRENKTVRYGMFPMDDDGNVIGEAPCSIVEKEIGIYRFV